MGRRGVHVSRNSNTKIDVAILKEQYRNITDKLNKMDNKLDNITLCANNHDNRIQKLEGWQGSCKDIEEKDNTRFNKKIAVCGIIIGIISFIASIIINILIG